MTSPARWSSLTMSARMSRASARSGGCCARRRCAAWALVRMMASGWFNSCASEPDNSLSVVTRERWASSLRCRCCLGFGLFAGGDVNRRAQHPDRLSVRVRIDPAPGREPALGAVRQHHAEFRSVVALVLQRAPHRRAPPSSRSSGWIRWMTFFKADGRIGCEPEQVEPPLRTPDLVARDAPHPNANPAASVARVIRSSLSRRSSDNCAARSTSPAHFVGHRRDDAQEEQARRERRVDHLPEHQHGSVPWPPERRTRCCRPATSACRRSPRRQTVTHGVHDEDHEQQETHLTDQHPRIGDTLGDGDGFAEERDVPQAGDLAVVEVRREEEIEDERQRAHAADRVQASHGRPARR